MRISNLSFPYPVLGVKDDIHGQHKVAVEIRLAEDNIYVKATHTFFNESLEELIREKKAIFCAQIICSKTFFRNVYLSQDKNQEIVIPQDQLRDKVSVDFFVVAKKDIPNYANKKAHKDYSGYKFFVGKGDALSFGGNFSFVAAKQWMASKSVASFMAIICGDRETGPMKIDLTRGDGKIVIELSSKDYERYCKNSKSEVFYPLYHSCIVFPALMYALIQMSTPDGKDDYGDRLWFQILEEKKKDKKLAELDWSDPSNAAEIAQTILDEPLNRVFNSIEELTNDPGDEE